MAFTLKTFTLIILQGTKIDGVSAGGKVLLMIMLTVEWPEKRSELNLQLKP